MSNSQLIATSFNGGLRAPNYVNGRLLTAEDLRADQEAMLARLAQLGHAAGYGVVEGLTVVRADTTSVRVAAGLGLNRQGQIIRLPAPITLNLAPQAAETQPVEDAGRFKECMLQSASGGSVSQGAYLLTVVPASRLEGLAPIKATAGSTIPPGCAGKWEVEGLQFKAIRLNGFNPTASGVTNQNRRNLLAHWCYGSQELRTLPHDPFSFDAIYGGLDQIDPADLTPCDLPLAVFYWNGSAIAAPGDVDVWSARRRLIGSDALTGWEGLLSERRVAEGHARFLQFQEHLDTLRAAGSPASTAARTHFRFLPPVGYLPIRPPAWLIERLADHIGRPLLNQMLQRITIPFVSPSALNSLFNPSSILPQVRSRVTAQLAPTGFDLEQFFGNLLPDQIGLVDGETVDTLLQRSWYDEAIDLDQQPSFELYTIDERLVYRIVLALNQIVETNLSTLSSTFFGITFFINVNQIRNQIRQVWRQTVAELTPQLTGIRVDLAANLGSDPDQLYVIFVKTPRETRWFSRSDDNG